jgi:general stress protein 26
MLTTIEADGTLVSRPIATLASGPASQADLTFMTSTEPGKVDTLRGHAQVNASYLRSSTKEWVSVSGVARLSQDRARIHSLYKASWKAWLGDEGAPNDGGPNDPRIVLIDITAENVTYFKVDEPRPVVLFEVAKAMLTGEPAKVGEIRHVERALRAR